MLKANTTTTPIPTTTTTTTPDTTTILTPTVILILMDTVSSNVKPKLNPMLNFTTNMLTLTQPIICQPHILLDTITPPPWFTTLVTPCPTNTSTKRLDLPKKKFVPA